MLKRNAMLHRKISFNIGCCIKVYTFISKKITYKDENEETDITDINGTVNKARKLFNIYSTLFS